MSFAIKVEGLGKKYLIKHQASGRRYIALRDVLAEKAKGVFKMLKTEKLKSQNSDLSVSDFKNVSLSKTEEFWALKDVSFEVKPGEVVGIIGRNGAGKSTLLKLLSRITEPTAGRIRLRGRVASLLEVGTGFHPELTGRENIFLNGAVLGMHRAEIRKKFDEIVAFAEVEKFLDTPVKRYSSGMYMRLAFAVAAHLEPEILIVDEVLAVGDASFQKKCLGKMQDVSVREGRTVLFVSHNMEAIIRLCASCIYLVRGELKMQGETRQVIRSYSEHSRQLSREIDLTSLPRRNEGTGGARLLCLSGVQDETTAAWCYEYGRPFVFSVEFSVSVLLAEPEIGYAIFSNTGTELFSTTTCQECPLDQLSPGRYVIRITIPDLPLNPGTYILALGIAALGRNLDHVAEAAQIEIIPSKLSTQKGLNKIMASVSPHTIFELSRRQ